MAESHRPTAWAEICKTEFQALFDDAESGIDLFVELELTPLSKSLLRALDLKTLLHDVVIVGEGATVLARTGEWPTPLLESEFRLSEAFARWCIGPVGLDLFINQTMGLLQDALARRHGRERAQELIDGAIESFGAVRANALHHLARGPRTVSLVCGPSSYLVAPAVWLAVSTLAGAGRRERERTETRYGRALRGLIGAPPRKRLAQARAATAGLLTVATAAVAATVGTRITEPAEDYRHLLVEVETMILTGGFDDKEPVGMGLLEIVASLDAVTS